MSSGPSQAKATAPTAATTGIASVAALLALQEEDGPAERRRRALKRGGGLLDRLEAVKVAMLSDGDGSAALQSLARMAAEQRQGDPDPGLQDVLDHIETRAAVELAKAVGALETAAAEAAVREAHARSGQVQSADQRTADLEKRSLDLARQAVTDPLTMLPNRKGINEHLVELLEPMTHPDNKGELADYDKGAARWRASAGRGDGRCQPLSALPHRTQTIGPCEPMQFD